MSALAQISRMEGNGIFGSDRAFDLGQAADIKEKFGSLGIGIYPQDGRVLDKTFDAVIVSTAVEDSNPEIVRAKELGLEIIHRSDFLASYLNKNKTVAVGGTSGKSTVAAMIFHILRENGLDPSIITGGALNSLMEKGLPGNAFSGKGEWLVIEADESDGTIAKYSPAAGIVLNVSRDHKDVEELKKIFSVFINKSKTVYLGGDDENLRGLAEKAVYFGLSEASGVKLSPYRSEFTFEGVKFEIPLPGLYNISNALCAIKFCRGSAGLPLEKIARAFASYKGVFRRFNVLGEKKGVVVVDDFAHNPAKIEAALGAAHIDGSKRVIAVYQPHGFTPTRTLKAELIESFSRGLNEGDLLFMPEIYYVGGTVSKNISSLDLVNPLREKGKKAFYFEKRPEITKEIKKAARPGDLILVMGARDLTLHSFAEEIYNSL